MSLQETLKEVSIRLDIFSKEYVKVNVELAQQLSIFNQKIESKEIQKSIEYIFSVNNRVKKQTNIIQMDIRLIIKIDYKKLKNLEDKMRRLMLKDTQPNIQIFDYIEKINPKEAQTLGAQYYKKLTPINELLERLYNKINSYLIIASNIEGRGSLSKYLPSRRVKLRTRLRINNKEVFLQITTNFDINKNQICNMTIKEFIEYKASDLLCYVDLKELQKDNIIKNSKESCNNIKIGIIKLIEDTLILFLKNNPKQFYLDHLQIYFT
ncbi:MAG: hypothetical protein AABX19_00945 [Nanoarchaeota archaeon]